MNGELIIYAPHIHEVSVVHGKLIEEIGYHCVEYFLTQWDKFKHYPWGTLAHSTHVRGIGKVENGIERCRARVTLATGISPEVCAKINLGYRDPGLDRRGELCEPGRRRSAPGTQGRRDALPFAAAAGVGGRESS